MVKKQEIVIAKTAIVIIIVPTIIICALLIGVGNTAFINVARPAIIPIPQSKLIAKKASFRSSPFQEKNSGEKEGACEQADADTEDIKIENVDVLIKKESGQYNRQSDSCPGNKHSYN